MSAAAASTAICRRPCACTAWPPIREMRWLSLHCGSSKRPAFRPPRRAATIEISVGNYHIVQLLAIPGVELERDALELDLIETLTFGSTPAGAAARIEVPRLQRLSEHAISVARSAGPAPRVGAELRGLRRARLGLCRVRDGSPVVILDLQIAGDASCCHAVLDAIMNRALLIHGMGLNELVGLFPDRCTRCNAPPQPHPH